MTPNNPPESAHQQQIVTIVDKDGVTHKVIPLNHTHSQSEVSGLTTDLANKMDAKTIDSAPADNADHLVSSKGVYDALADKADINTPNSKIANGDGASVAFSQNGDVLISPKTGRNVAFMFDGTATSVSASNAGNLVRALQTPDSTPTANSDNLVTSGGVAAALAEKMDDKTIDSTPANNSDHLVSSKGVYDAINDLGQDMDHYLEGKADKSVVNAALAVQVHSLEIDQTYGTVTGIYVDNLFQNGNTQVTLIVDNLTGEDVALQDAFTTNNQNDIAFADERTVIENDSILMCRILKRATPNPHIIGHYYLIIDGVINY